jgi:hypothetical protein
LKSWRDSWRSLKVTDCSSISSSSGIM